MTLNTHFRDLYPSIYAWSLLVLRFLWGSPVYVYFFWSFNQLSIDLEKKKSSVSTNKLRVTEAGPVVQNVGSGVRLPEFKSFLSGFVLWAGASQSILCVPRL